MEHEYLTIMIRLSLAVLAGAVIGLERTYHGRAAGFRTHTLVCTASSLLMLLTVYQWELIANAPLDTIRVDPTRMAQGIMTGIGFLGAGAIIKERLTIRGLTTAASIWMTASIGIIIGMGFYFAAFVASVYTIGILSLFRWIESKVPTLRYGSLTIRFLRKEHLSEAALLDLIKEHDISGTNPSYQLEEEGKMFIYQMTIRTRDAANYRTLSETLSAMEHVQGFSITPSSD